MRSKTLDRIAKGTYRKVHYNVDAYAKAIVSGVLERFHYYWDWKSFNIGFGVTCASGISGWKYMISLDLPFFVCWLYFGRIKKLTLKNR